MEIIDGKEYYTVKEVAAIWQVSTQAVYKRIQRFGQVGGQVGGQVDNHVIRVQNRIYVDAATVSAFTDQTSGQDKSKTSPPTDETSSTTSIDALVDLLRGQLEAKDAEIERLHAEIDKLHKLLDQAHQLAAMSQTKELEAPVEEMKCWWRRRRK